jgi:hypothetical protein
MMRYPLLLLALAFCTTGSAASAEEMSTFVDSINEEGDTFSVVGFDYESCGGECYVGTLLCDESGTITVELADVAASDVAEAILKDTGQVLVTAGDLTVSYDLTEMLFQEMTVSWWISSRAADQRAPQLPAAIAGAKEVMVAVGKQTVTLPVDDTVKTWALACK